MFRGEIKVVMEVFRPEYRIYLLEEETIMHEGEIIRFYRKKAGLSQEQLGKDICTATHVSKIELGQTKYSPELISLFSTRLGVDIAQEIHYMKDVKCKLEKWYTSIIMQRMKEVEEGKAELEKYPSILSSSHAAYYQLLLARYYLLHKKEESASKLVKLLENQTKEMNAYEQNLFKHVSGLCYLEKYNSFQSENRKKAIEILESIDGDTYDNEEYHYHLAIAYHWVGYHTMAYINAEKAFHYFKRTNAFRRAIQAESVMLLQYGSVTKTEFKHVEERYKSLISDCDSLNEPSIKAMLLHNFGFEYFKRKQYQQAQNFFKQALLMAPKQSSLYLNRLYNYLDSCIEGSILPKADMYTKAKDGFHLAQKLKNPLYQHIFSLLLFKLEEKYEGYYQYIERTALPFFQSNEHFTMLNKFGQQLYDHYAAAKDFEKTVRVGEVLKKGQPV